MGEASTRRRADPLYGRVPKAGRGIVLTTDYKVDAQGGAAFRSGINPNDLRNAVLFWDRVAWPQSRTLGFGGGPDESLLEQEGVLTRPIDEHWQDGPAGHGYSASMAHAFSVLDSKEPGLWAMGGGLDAPVRDVVANTSSTNRGALVTLFRCIPLPDAQIPMERLLEFRLKRRVEMAELQLAIDDLYLEISASGDPVYALARNKQKVEDKAIDAIRVAGETGLKFWLGDWQLNTSFDVDSVEKSAKWAAVGGTAGSWLGAALGVPLPLAAVGSVVGGALPFLSVSGSWGARVRGRSSPWRYVTHVHKELLPT